MAHNPYSPPIAPVADAALVPKMPRPWQVAVAVCLVWLSMLISAVGIAIEPSSLDIGDVGLMIYALFAAAALGLFLLVIFASVCIASGQRWARIIYSALVVLSLLDVYSHTAKVFANSWTLGAFDLLGTAVDVTTVILMFTPPANAWFRRPRN